LLLLNFIDDIMHTVYSKCEEIANLFSSCAESEDEIGLLSSTCGISLFLFYSGKYFNNATYFNKGSEYLNAIFNSIPDHPSVHHTFCSGLSGFGWTFNHLADTEFIEGTEDQISEMDDLVFEAALNDIDRLVYDYLHGAVGVGFYFVMKRSISKKQEGYLQQLIDRLYEIRIEVDDGMTWKDYFSLSEEEKNSGITRYNLGLAHGIPGIIIFLSKCYEKGIHTALTKKMIEGAMRFILSNKVHPTTAIESFYPSWIDTDKELNRNSRLAWCYGDLGIAAGFWQAGKSLNNETWKTESMEIMLHASKRRDLPKNGVLDAGICHGTSGIAHLFNRFYFETKMQVFKETADYWIDETLKMAYHPDGPAGYKSWHGKDQEWVDRHSILDGIAGIGLVLLSHLSEEEPKWDNCLLLS
jgi:lantibiotic modifying enzyme